MSHRSLICAVLFTVSLTALACGQPSAAPPAAPPAAVASTPAPASTEPAASPAEQPATIQPEAASPAPTPSPAASPAGAEEIALVTSAMKTYADECFGEPGHMAISKVVVRGDRAVGISTIINRPEIDGEMALVFMKKVNGRWVGQDYGSGLEPPSWYPHW